MSIFLNETPLISLCMIVKNEEQHLGRCLESARSFVDEIIVVDTGSSDRTCEVASEYGARIYHHPWEGNFSKHRNQSLAYARGKWIFQLDADEELVVETGPALRDIALRGKAEYYHCRFLDMRRDGSVHGVFHLVRLFRNGMGMHYVRKVHNQLFTVGRGEYCNVSIKHYGYDLSPERMMEKHIRTTTLLKEMITENPNDVYSLFQLSSSYSMHREFDEAVKYGFMALEIMRRENLRDDFFHTVYYTVIHGLMALGRNEDAVALGKEALKQYPSHLDVCYLLSQIYFRARDARACRNVCNRYLSIYHCLSSNPSLMGNHYYHSLGKKHEILFTLGCLDCVEGHFKDAEEHFAQALQESGLNGQIASDVYNLFLSMSRPENAENWLIKLYHSEKNRGHSSPFLEDKPGFYLKLGKIFLHRGDIQAASECIEKIGDKTLTDAESGERDLLMAQSAWHTGDIEGLVVYMDALARRFGVNTKRVLNSVKDLACLITEIAAHCITRGHAELAAECVRFASEITPAS